MFFTKHSTVDRIKSIRGNVRLSREERMFAIKQVFAELDQSIDFPDGP
jgi:hypothetical protein